MNRSTMIWSLLVVLAASFTLYYAYSMWWRPSTIIRRLRKQGVPFAGCCRTDKHDYGQSKFGKLSHNISPMVNARLHEQMTQYGDTFLIMAREGLKLIILDPKLVQEIHLNPKTFGKMTVHWIMPYVIGGIAFLNGEKWRKHRSMMNAAFHLDNLKEMMPSFMSACEEIVDKWDQTMGDKESFEIDVNSEFVDLAGDAISRAAFGSNLTESKRILRLQTEQNDNFIRLTKCYNWFEAIKLLIKLWKIYWETYRLIGAMVDEREEALLTKKEAGHDLLTLLLKSNAKHRADDRKGKPRPLTRTEIIMECKFFYFAGQESTANVLSWTLVLLGENQDWQERARNEVLNTLGRTNKPTFNQLKSLKIVNMVLLEVLRLYPPAPIFRCSLSDGKLRDLKIPHGVFVESPLYVVHRDKRYWGDDAMEFNPERFANGVSMASKDQLAYFPFGNGPRICLGQNFAMIEAKVGLTLILQRFAVKISPSYTHAPFLHLTLRPRYGAPVLLRRL